MASFIVTIVQYLLTVDVNVERYQGWEGEGQLETKAKFEIRAFLAAV
jgi:hypothetical protein